MAQFTPWVPVIALVAQVIGIFVGVKVALAVVKTELVYIRKAMDASAADRERLWHRVDENGNRISRLEGQLGAVG